MDEGLEGGMDFGVKLRRGNGWDKRDMVREVDQILGRGLKGCFVDLKKIGKGYMVGEKLKLV